MELLSYWLKYVILWTAFATVLTKETGKDTVSEDGADETMTGMAMRPFHSVAPVVSYYGFHYPLYFPGHQMREGLQEIDDDEVQPPKVRSIKESHKTGFKTPCRREVLLWPRPSGWEWDGTTYKWGPGNIFFGGPGFPW